MDEHTYRVSCQVKCRRRHWIRFGPYGVTISDVDEAMLSLGTYLRDAPLCSMAL